MKRIFFDKLQGTISKIKLDLLTLWYAIRHPDMPKPLKILALCICAYAFSPIDLIPDFIPVLGYLDDIILLPVGVYLVFKFLPQSLLNRVREQAREHMEANLEKPKSYAGLLVVIVLWFLMSLGIYHLTNNIMD